MLNDEQRALEERLAYVHRPVDERDHPAFPLMVHVIEEYPRVIVYEQDVTYWDRLILNQKKPTEFLWVVYPFGSHLMIMDQTREPDEFVALVEAADRNTRGQDARWFLWRRGELVSTTADDGIRIARAWAQSLISEASRMKGVSG